jgi:hypothetical protein
MIMESMMVVERIATIARIPSKSHPVTWIHSVPHAKELSIHFSSPPHIVSKVMYVSMFKKG